MRAAVRERAAIVEPGALRPAGTGGRLISAKWLASVGSVGEPVRLEALVERALVRDGTKVAFEVFDAGGASVELLSGSVKAGRAMAEWTYTGDDDEPGSDDDDENAREPEPELDGARYGYENLRRGRRGDAVAALQAALNEVGASPQLEPDGIFGKQTKRAVKDFQVAHGLESDGIVGPLTMAALDEARGFVAVPEGETSPDAAPRFTFVASLGDEEVESVPLKFYTYVECTYVDKETGAPIPCRYVLCLGAGSERTGTSDDDGFFRIDRVPPGRVRLRLTPVADGDDIDDVKDRGVPFAPHGTGLYWPIKTSSSEGRKLSYQDARGKGRGNWARRFFADRKGRKHAAMDLYGRHGDPVVACEAGEIVNYYHFHRGTYALIVQNDSGTVINYGEVDPESLKNAGFEVKRVGHHNVYLTEEDKKADKVWKTVPRYKLVQGGDYRVSAGQRIGEVGKMLKGSMLHFEMYVDGTTQTAQVKNASSPPKSLLDPTKYLIHLAANGL
jgi:hypothetical protein